MSEPGRSHFSTAPRRRRRSGPAARHASLQRKLREFPADVREIYEGERASLIHQGIHPTRAETTALNVAGRAMAWRKRGCDAGVCPRCTDNTRLLSRSEQGLFVRFDKRLRRHWCKPE